MTASEIEIKLYEPWMKEQLIALNEAEYPFMKGWFRKRFDALYESDYTRSRNHVVVAVRDTNKVVACISYIPWPLCYNGNRLNAFQMVGLLVHPSARGKGLFKRVLAQMDEHMAKLNPDVVIGFPVTESREGFLKQGWKNLFDLTWYVTHVNLAALFSQKQFTGKGFESGAPVPTIGDSFIQTCPEDAFWKLRVNFFPETPLYYNTYEVENSRIQIIFRIQKVKGFNIAVVGRIYSGTAGKEQIGSAIKMWKSDLKKERTVLAAMAAVNEACSSNEIQALRKVMFRLNKKITVIVKSHSNNSVGFNASGWNLMRGDMETW